LKPEIRIAYTYLLYIMSGTYSKADVQSHNKPDNLWIIVDDDVYDMTKFQVSRMAPRRAWQSANALA
jgi:cytochrome b involved in lipid metabolism